MKSTNPAVEELMDEIERIDPKDPELEIKLQYIAKRLAEEQRRNEPKTPISSYDLVDPADAFACEGCQ